MVRRIISLLVLASVSVGAEGATARPAGEHEKPERTTESSIAGGPARHAASHGRGPAVRFVLVASNSWQDDFPDGYFRMAPGATLEPPIGSLPLGSFRNGGRGAGWLDQGSISARARQSPFRPGAVSSVLATLALAIFFFLRRTR